MAARLAAFITGEGHWLPLAMGLAFAMVSARWLRRPGSATRDVMDAMNLFVGVTLLVMGIGHLLAVTTKLLQDALNGSPALLYLIGVAIVVPAALIIGNTNHPRAAAYNGWMAVTLVVLGLINIPLAIPALLNIGYARHSRPRTRLAIVVAFVAVNLGLFAGGMMFLLSGASTFEEFTR
jgi:hypothetical protein